MKYYLKDILNRLQKHSATLDQSSFLVDKPWVVSNNNEKFEKLIFKRDGTVFLSVNGDVTLGKWEYLPEAQSLYIDYGDKKKLYKHQYLDEAVLALKIDGPDQGDESYYLLANENVVGDYNPKKYLFEKYQQFSIGGKSKQEKVIPDLKTGLKKHSSGMYLSADEKTLMQVQDGKIISKRNLYTYSNGINIWQKNSVPILDDIVENNRDTNFALFSEDRGKFQITTDANGVITKVKDRVSRLMEIFVIIAIVVITIICIIFLVS